jgi:hypothetical protein
MGVRYEVTQSDASGSIVQTEHFRGSERAEAIRYRQEHPHSTGWTFRARKSGAEDCEVGLHAATTWEG